MRLLFVIKGLVVEGGGAERVLVDVANELTRCGVHVEILTFDSPGQSVFYTIDDRIHIHMVGGGAAGQPTPKQNIGAVLLKIRTVAQQLAPDAVISFMHSSYVISAAALMGTKIPHVVSEHTSARHYKGRPVQAILARTAEWMAVAKTVPSQAVLAEHAKGSSKVRVLANPLHLDFDDSTPEIPPSTSRTVLCVGRFWPEKGHDVLLHAFAQLRLEFPDWRLRLAGDGKLRGELETLIAELGLTEVVEMPGMIRDVDREYRNAAVLVMPSYYESFGLVAAEALARNRPVIGFSDCRGASELIRHEQNGILVEPGNGRAQALAEAMRNLMADGALRDKLGANGRESIAYLDIGSVADQWQDLVKEIIAKT